MARSRWLRTLAGLSLVLGLLVGCGEGSTERKFQLTDVTGVNWGKTLALTDASGKRRTLDEFKGKVVVLFFGFAHCPDVCPTTLSELATVAKELGAAAKDLQVLMVTVDPERDTPEVLRQYVPAFHPSFLGLYGTLEETAAVAKEFKVYYQKQPTQSGDYTVDHGAGTYVFDKAGRLRLFGSYGAGAKPLLHDIRVLLNE